jgi:hypothetical protein
MAMQSGSGSVFAITAGAQEPVFLTLSNVTERNTVHATGKGTDVIPPQRPNGAGLDVYIGQAVQQPGFYSLTAAGSDTTQVALNQQKGESLPSFRDMGALEKDWKGDNIKWMSITESGALKGGDANASFPLWKVCVILALIMLALETFLLARKQAAVA